MTPCEHPPERLYTGFYKHVPKKSHMWVACCKCGEVIQGSEAEAKDRKEWGQQDQAGERNELDRVW